MAKKSDRYKASVSVYRGQERKSLDTVNRFRRVHALPELISVSNVDPAAPRGDRTYTLSLSRSQQHALMEMDFANAEARVAAHLDVESYLVQQLARAHADAIDRYMRGERGVYFHAPRLHGSSTGRTSSREQETASQAQRRMEEANRLVLNFGVQALNAERAFADLGDAIQRSIAPELNSLAREMVLPVQSVDDLIAALNFGFSGHPAAPAEKPKEPPRHPETGKLIERKRKMRRTLLGAEVRDYREASGGVARVAELEVTTLKHINRRKRS